MTYAEMTDRVKAVLAYEEWRKEWEAANRIVVDDAAARAAFVAGYRLGFDAGYEQGECADQDI